jgi:hypothetical protein
MNILFLFPQNHRLLLLHPPFFTIDTALLLYLGASLRERHLTLHVFTLLFLKIIQQRHQILILETRLLTPLGHSFHFLFLWTLTADCSYVFIEVEVILLD